jgi:hypothetical protein
MTLEFSGNYIVKVSKAGSDAETPSQFLSLTVVSSNLALLPPENIFIGSSGADRIMTLFPISVQIGSTTITITVTEPGRGGPTGDLVISSSRSFHLRVQASAPPPMLNASRVGDEIAISWPSAAASYHLEQSSSLMPPWFAVTAARVLEADRIVVSMPIPNGMHFFRLVEVKSP